MHCTRHDILKGCNIVVLKGCNIVVWIQGVLKSSIQAEQPPVVSSVAEVPSSSFSASSSKVATCFVEEVLQLCTPCNVCVYMILDLKRPMMCATGSDDACSTTCPYCNMKTWKEHQVPSLSYCLTLLLTCHLYKAEWRCKSAYPAHKHNISVCISLSFSNAKLLWTIRQAAFVRYAKCAQLDGCMLDWG